MNERIAAVLAIMIFEYLVLVTLLKSGFGLTEAVAAAGTAGAAAAEIAYRLLGQQNGPGGGNPFHQVRLA